MDLHKLNNVFVLNKMNKYVLESNLIPYPALLDMGKEKMVANNINSGFWGQAFLDVELDEVVGCMAKVTCSLRTRGKKATFKVPLGGLHIITKVNTSDDVDIVEFEKNGQVLKKKRNWYKRCSGKAEDGQVLFIIDKGHPVVRMPEILKVEREAVEVKPFKKFHLPILFENIPKMNEESRNRVVKLFPGAAMSVADSVGYMINRNRLYLKRNFCSMTAGLEASNELCEYAYVEHLDDWIGHEYPTDTKECPPTRPFLGCVTTQFRKNTQALKEANEALVEGKNSYFQTDAWLGGGRDQLLGGKDKLSNAVLVGPNNPNYDANHHQLRFLTTHEVEDSLGLPKGYTDIITNNQTRNLALGSAFCARTIARELKSMGLEDYMRTINRGLRVLSLFDGCGTAMIALKKILKVKVDTYVSVEINKHIQNCLKEYMKDKVKDTCMLYVDNVFGEWTNWDVHERDGGALDYLTSIMGPFDVVILGPPCSNFAFNNQLKHIQNTNQLDSTDGKSTLVFDAANLINKVEESQNRPVGSWYTHHSIAISAHVTNNKRQRMCDGDTPANSSTQTNTTSDSETSEEDDSGDETWHP